MTTLAVRLAQAILEVGGALAADKRNLEQRYDYISADKILSIGGQALARAGVVIVPAITEASVELATYEKIYNGKAEAKTRFDATVSFAMTVTDGETSLEYPWTGAGSDYAVPDKAKYKAITSGHKYFVAKLLMIGVGNEDPEHDTPEESAPLQRRVAPPPVKANGNGKAITPSDGIRKAIHARGMEIFGSEWDAARHWMVGVWTAKHTPTNPRSSSSELTDEEMVSLVNDMNRYPDALRQRWQLHKETASITIDDSPELAFDQEGA